MSDTNGLVEVADGHWIAPNFTVFRDDDGRYSAYDEEGWRFTTSKWENVVLLAD